MLRLYVMLVVLSALLVAVAVAGGHGGAYGSRDLLPPRLEVDRIAYVSLEGQIRTVAPNGESDELVSPESGFFTWPTWSPGGRRLVFSGVLRDEGDEPQTVLYARNTITGRLQELYSGEPGELAIVARGAPHYPYWSPDGSMLAFIDASSRGLGLYLDDVRDDAAPRYILGDGPLWMGWSPDSEQLLIHRRTEHFMVRAEDGRALPLPMSSDIFGYRVPSWKPSGDAITFVLGDGSEGYTLYVADPAGLDGRPVRDVPSNTAFLWSPDGEWLAVTRPQRVLPFQQMDLLVYRRISLIRPDDAARDAEIEGNAVAFFWSPDSTKLAYVTITNTPGVLRWNIYDVAEGKEQALVDFLPSADHLTVFRYFDQYASSHLQWSPDSSAIVFAGRLAGTAISASVRQQQPDRIIVASVPPRLTVDVIAKGLLGFWSPR